ncbi:MAG: hypothetical protein L0312_00215 [Acidobacteria bacterium]|nr:hypothetical protein [Acidobacteriota bacterium]
MIQPLRRAHQGIMAGLTLVLPTIFVAGLAVRQPSPPVSESLPGRCASARNISEAMRSFQKVLAPDLLVYWARAVPSDGTLPPDARLLGSLYGTQGLDVSPVSGGYLLAYSLPDRRVVAYVAIRKAVEQL